MGGDLLGCGDLQALDAAVSSLSAGTIAPREPSTDDQIAEAEKAGDWETFDRLQAAKLVR